MAASMSRPRLLLVGLLVSCFMQGAFATSSSTSRPPFSLSTIINDLEAEGVERGISTIAVLASESITSKQKDDLLKDLITSGLNNEEKDSVLEDVAGDGLTTIGRLVGGAGVAFACAETPSEAASTGMACGKKMVYLCSKLDLRRGEGLFNTLAPAIEAASNYAQRSIEDGSEENEDSLLIVLLPCAQGDTSSLSDMEKTFTQHSAAMLQNLASKATSLKDIFTRVLFLPQEGSSTCDAILSNLASADSGIGFQDPAQASAAIANVAKATFNLESLFSSVGADSLKSLTAEEVASVRVAIPAMRSALEKAYATVSERTLQDGDNSQLVSDFGELCDAAYQSALESYDDAVGKDHRSGGSTLIKKIRNELSENVAMEFETFYEGQLAELKTAMFEKCRKELSQLRVSPNLSSDMEEKMEATQKEFNSIAGKLIPKIATTSSSWASFGNAAKADFKRTIKEYCTERLLAAKASGAFRPIPRKAIALGLHWLLPRPFGSDHRQATLPNELRRNYVYHSPEGRSEVNPNDVKEGKGSWKSKIVPSPTASDMLY